MERGLAAHLRRAHHGLGPGRGAREIEDGRLQAGCIGDERQKPTGGRVLIQQMVYEMRRRLEGEHEQPRGQQGRPDPPWCDGPSEATEPHTDERTVQSVGEGPQD